MIFLKLIFILFIAEIIFVAFFEKERPVKFKQIIRKKNGRKYYRIDYLGRLLRGGKLKW